jgi:hypothetical protein
MSKRRRLMMATLVVVALAATSMPAGAHVKGMSDPPELLGPDGVTTGISRATLGHNEDAHSANMSLRFNFATGVVNSDLAFWGNRAYMGNYSGFQIYDVSDPRHPTRLVDYFCFGPQNDPIVWKNKLLFLSVDQTLEGPECGSEVVASDDPTGWEGVRIFDVSRPRNPRLIKGVYTDCGAHTITMYPKSSEELLIYVSSYPLRPGPTCGPVRGPEAGNDPLHRKISVISVPVDAPQRARVIAQPRIRYPGDPDNKFDPAEHGLDPALGLNPLTACHDISVFVELKLAAAACAEQAQLWRIRDNGIPRTRNPIWVYDDSTDTDGPGGGDVAVDFWHSATFSWDGEVINFIDESFGSGCPPVTPIGLPFDPEREPNSDTGRMFFVDTDTGEKLSHFMIPNREPDDPIPYCSAHLGAPVHAQRDLLVNAWYRGGVDVIDFSNPSRPREIAWYDRVNGDNWSAYWYEGPSLPGDALTIYATDGVHDPSTGAGFEVFRVNSSASEVPLRHLNPQTQERVLR